MEVKASEAQDCKDKGKGKGQMGSRSEEKGALNNTSIWQNEYDLANFPAALNVVFSSTDCWIPVIQIINELSIMTSENT